LFKETTTATEEEAKEIKNQKEYLYSNLVEFLKNF
jgi:hypothetical protein